MRQTQVPDTAAGGPRRGWSVADAVRGAGASSATRLGLFLVVLLLAAAGGWGAGQMLGPLQPPVPAGHTGHL